MKPIRAGHRTGPGEPSQHYCSKFPCAFSRSSQGPLLSTLSSLSCHGDGSVLIRNVETLWLPRVGEVAARQVLRLEASQVYCSPGLIRYKCEPHLEQLNNAICCRGLRDEVHRANKICISCLNAVIGSPSWSSIEHTVTSVMWKACSAHIIIIIPVINQFLYLQRQQQQKKRKGTNVSVLICSLILMCQQDEHGNFL